MNDFEKTATKVTINNMIANVFLSLFKMGAGWMFHSMAMISDGANSASDVLSSLLVLFGIKMSQKEADTNHPYGHERLECVVAIILSVVVLATGLGIGLTALEQLLSGMKNSQESPSYLAMIAGIISILVKEGMVWYTRHYAHLLDSSALMAVAWDHRSDSLSSIGVLVGVMGARLGYPICDAFASLVVCGFIIKAALEIFKDAIDKMIDHRCDEETEQALKECILSCEGVLEIDFFQTRVFGNKIYVDLEIGVDANHSLSTAHDISEEVHDRIETQFPKVKHIMIHVNPKEKTDATNGCQIES